MPDHRVQTRWAPGGGRTRWRLERLQGETDGRGKDATGSAGENERAVQVERA